MEQCPQSSKAFLSRLDFWPNAKWLVLPGTLSFAMLALSIHTAWRRGEWPRHFLVAIGGQLEIRSLCGQLTVGSRQWSTARTLRPQTKSFSVGEALILFQVLAELTSLSSLLGKMSIQIPSCQLSKPLQMPTV